MKCLIRLKSYFWEVYHSIMDIDQLSRFDRIVAILIQLQSKRIVKAQELADRFQVSLRTIYRDIRSLEASGVPIASEAGVGYSIMEGYRLPPVMFTREEAGSFVAAEKLMQKFTDKTLGAYYESAMYKVRSVLQGSSKDLMNALESQVLISPAHKMFNENIPNALELLFESLAGKKQVWMRYTSFNAEKSSERNIEPVGLFHENSYWYIMAYCHLRKEYRQFRTDRIEKIRLCEETFTRKHGPLEQYRQPDPDCPKVKVRISMDREVSRYINVSKNYFGFVSEETKGDQVIMTFMTGDLNEGFPRWYLMFGDKARILEPAELNEKIRQLLNKTLEKL